MNIAPAPRALTTINQLQQQHNQIMVPIGPPPPLPPNLPCGHLIEGSREDYVKLVVPLYEASIEGNWKTAKAIFDQRPELIRFAITKNYETPLHIAVYANSTRCAEQFLENLVNMMEKKDLELQNKSYHTALTLAATVGNEKAAKVMVKKNKAILEISDSNGMMPLQSAALSGKSYMVRYLYNMSNKLSGDCWEDENRGWVLQKCVEMDLYDIAREIVNDCIKLTSNKRLLQDVLLVLAKRTRAFRDIDQVNDFTKIIIPIFVVNRQRESEALQFFRIIWNEIGIMPNNEIDHILQGPPLEIEEGQHKKITYPSQALFVAAENGNVKFVTELLRTYPDLIWTLDDRGLSIFHVAIEHRQQDIYNLLYEIGSLKELITTIEDKNGNNMLHLVAKKAKSEDYMSVFVIKMQHELFWFQDVEQMIPPSYRERKNIDGETPHDILTKDHKELLHASEKWMKDIVPQCLVGATIIATMTLTSALSPPGGYDQNTGKPTLLHEPAFLVFIIAYNLSLLCSAAAILILISLLTSRYDARDFLDILPGKLILSCATLYLSVLTGAVAYTAGCFAIYYDNKLKWVPIVVAGVAGNVFVILNIQHFSFYREIFHSFKGSRYLFKPKKHMLYTKNSS